MKSIFLILTFIAFILACWMIFNGAKMILSNHPEPQPKSVIVSTQI